MTRDPLAPLRALAPAAAWLASRGPHFHSDALNNTLTNAGLEYHQLVELGGRRTARPDSPNRGWKNAGFRGYADYMSTEAFQQALHTLMTDAAASRTAIMCAEAVPWRCHRTLVADALVIHGWQVVHILGPGQIKRHELKERIRIDKAAAAHRPRYALVEH